MAKKYANGRAAWGECGRSGRKMLLNDMVFDGQYPNMRVDPAWYEPKHPQENLKRIDDPVALWRPAPENLAPPTAPVLIGALTDGPVIPLSWTAAESGISQITRYELYRSHNGGAVEIVYSFDVERDMFGGITNDAARAYLDIDVIEDDTYSYYVVATALQGGISTSNVVEILAQFLPPTAPALTGELFTISSNRLEWTAASSQFSTISAYSIYRSVNSAAFTLLNTTDGITLTYIDTDAAGSDEWRYYVVATAAEGGDSDPSNTVTLSAADIVDEYLTPGSYTWTKRPGLVSVDRRVIGAGAGGGSGRVGNGAEIQIGGGGGGAGGLSEDNVLVADLGATENVTVGAAGIGGPSVTFAPSAVNGLDGTDGGASSFGALIANGGQRGTGGYNTGGLGGPGGTGTTQNGGAGGQSKFGEAAEDGQSRTLAPGGGGAANTLFFGDHQDAGDGGTGSSSANPASGGAGGAGDGLAGGSGSATAAKSGGGGGGGRGQYGFTSQGGAGGSGGNYGAGGGGGGAAEFTANSSGQGGTGAGGYVRAVNHFR